MGALKILILLIIFKSIMYVLGPSISFFYTKLKFRTEGQRKIRALPKTLLILQSVSKTLWIFQSVWDFYRVIILYNKIRLDTRLEATANCFDWFFQLCGQRSEHILSIFGHCKVSLWFLKIRNTNSKIWRFENGGGLLIKLKLWSFFKSLTQYQLRCL